MAKTTTLKIRIDWSELDLFGHVNNLNYFKYAQAGRLSFFDHAGWSQNEKVTPIGPILARTECDFIVPLKFPGQVEVQTTVKEIGNTSFKLAHQIISANQLSAQVNDVIVCFDFVKQVKAEMPAWLRKTLLENLG